MAVGELYGRYSHAFDSGEAQRCAELFTSDATFTTHGRAAIVGRPALVEFFATAAARSPGVRHFVSNVVLDGVAGDRVTGMAYVLVLRIDGDVLRLASIGTYRDEFVCDGGRWLISSRYFVPAIPDGLAGAVLTARRRE